MNNFNSLLRQRCQVLSSCLQPGNGSIYSERSSQSAQVFFKPIAIPAGSSRSEPRTNRSRSYYPKGFVCRYSHGAEMSSAYEASSDLPLRADIVSSPGTGTSPVKRE